MELERQRCIANQMYMFRCLYLSDVGNSEDDDDKEAKMAEGNQACCVPSLGIDRS